MLEREVLERRTIEILEKTRKQTERYTTERKVLYQFSIDKNVNLEEWEKYLSYFENLIE